VLDVIIEEANRLVMLVGEPGSGKSTLLRYWSCLPVAIDRLPKTSGKISSLLRPKLEFGGHAGQRSCFQHRFYRPRTGTTFISQDWWRS